MSWCALLPRVAWGQVAVEPELEGGATIGVTSNVANTPVPPPDAPNDAPRPEWDGYGQLSPGFRLNFETQFSSHLLSYLLNYRFYFTHPEANAIQNTLGYAFNTELGRRTTLTLGLSGAQTQVSIFNVTGTPAANPNPGGDNLLYIGTASQSIAYDISELDTFSQGLSLTATHNVGEELQTQTYLASVTFNYDHQFESDSVGGTLGTSALYFPEQGELSGVLQPMRVDLFHRGAVRWHHEFNDSWSSDISAGALVGYLANDTSTVAAQPEASAAINFVYGLYTFGAEVAHAGQPNLLIQQAVLADSISLNTGAPLGRSNFDIAIGTSGNASRALLSEGGFSPVTYSVVAEATLGYQPVPLPLRLSLRYQFFRQFSFEDVPAGAVGVPDIRRQNLEFTITAYFPEAPGVGQASGLPPLLPAPTSNPDILRRQQETRGGAADREREERDEQREERERRSAPSGD